MVITDARLGGMSGYEFLGKIRGQWPELPALMITAYATPKLAVEAIKAGAMDYLAKPFAPEELFLAVSRCASGTGSCGKTPCCGRAQAKSSASSKSSANAPRCASCGS